MDERFAKTVSQILGHRDVRTTLAIYCHPSQDDRRKAMAALPWADASAGREARGMTGKCWQPVGPATEEALAV